MKFEDILPFMRQGKKAKHARMKSGEYWICKYNPLVTRELWPTLIKTVENTLQENTLQTDDNGYSWVVEHCWAIMEDSWEIVE